MKTIEMAGTSVAVVLLMASLTMQTAAAQTVYKSVDADGGVIYTDRPLADPTVEAVTEVDIVTTNSEELDANQAEAAKQAKAEGVADEIRENQSQEDAALQTAMADQRDAACRAANARMAKYSKARRLYREDESGERTYLDNAELDAERADAARAVDDLCG